MLTLLLTLKDRYDYTENILTYLNEIKFKYHIIIADGSSIINQEKLKQNIDNYSSLSIDLMNFKPDNSLTDYYSKLQYTSNKIRTKYTLLIDNDDYFSEEGCTSAIQFLENNNDFVAAGQICRFINHKKNLYFSNIKYNDITFDELNSRLEEYLKTPTVIWGLVVRTDVTIDFFNLLKQCDFEYLHLMEFLYNMFVISKGKIKYIYQKPCTYRRMITEDSTSINFIQKEKHYNFYYKNYFFTDWSKLTSSIKTFSNISDKKLEKYWFRGCVNGYLELSKFKYILTRYPWLRSLYYKFKYKKNWSNEIKKFDLIFQDNRSRL
jgi:glycosyltransferase domain-containing protein